MTTWLAYYKTLCVKEALSTFSVRIGRVDKRKMEKVESIHVFSEKIHRFLSKTLNSFT